MRRPTLRLSLECNNACVFCAQRGLDHVGEAHQQDSLRALRRESSDVTFVGGEPTLSEALPELIAYARQLGFRGIGIQTNGRRLMDRAYVTTLVAAGLTDVHLSIHGPDAAVHDYHVGVPGAFAESMTGAHQARANGLTVVATTVLTRSNYRVIVSMPPLLKARGISAWLISIPRTAGALGPGNDRVTPRLGLALPFALKALDDAGRIGVEPWIEGAPACTLGPYVARLLPAEPRAYAPICEQCPARPICPGVDTVYFSQFRGDELSARARTTPTTPTPITRLFVGVGELAPSVAAPAWPPSVAMTPLGLGSKAP